MNQDDLLLVRRTQPDGRWLFPYYRNHYAVDLLTRFLGEEKSKKEVQVSRFGRLLQKPEIRNAFSHAGDGVLRRSYLDALWPSNPECYRVTLAAWGDNDTDWHWDQVSRRGYSLVLQINFSERHDAAYRRWLGEGEVRPFDYSKHPVAQGDFHTLAWVRLDLDLEDGEVLIEEIQSDWIRYASRAYEASAAPKQAVAPGLAGWQRYLLRHGFDLAKIQRYYELALAPHLGHWSELAMSVAIKFVRDDLGIRSLWCHSPESGAHYKHIGGSKPPRSIYTSLPKGFCFEKIHEPPAFLKREQRNPRSARSPGSMSPRRRKRWVAGRNQPKLDFWHLELP
jgi:hypothetical protein